MKPTEMMVMVVNGTAIIRRTSTLYASRASKDGCHEKAHMVGT